MSTTHHMHIAVSVNDNKAMLQDGVLKPLPNPTPDTISLIELDAKPPKLLIEIEVPASVVGPPLSVAITPNGQYALVTNSTQIDPNNPTRFIPDNKLTLVDLTTQPPAIIMQTEAGKGASGLSISPQGNLVLVANRNEGTVSVFKFKDKKLTKLDTIKLGDENSNPAHAAFTPDGKHALVTRDGDSFVSVLKVDGEKVSYTKYDITCGMRPYGIAVNPNGKMAVVANVGRSSGDMDTISIIDLTSNPFRAIDIYPVPPTPEGVMISPNGELVAVVCHNGTNKPRSFPFYHEYGLVALFRIDGMHLKKIGEAKIGQWSQGVVFSQDSKTMLVQNMEEKELQVFHVSSEKIEDTGQRIKVKGGPSGIRIAGSS